MQLKPKASLQLDCDQPITRWDDSILAPKNQNIHNDNLIHLPNRPYNRKHILATKRWPTSKNSSRTDQNRDKQNQKVWRGPDKCQISNFNKYKQKIENIDREIGRWEEVSHQKINRVLHTNHNFMKVHSGLLKAFTEGEEGLAKSLGRGRFLSKSIDYNNGEDIDKSRPMSCHQDRLKKQSIFNNKASERSKTIHSKAKIKRSFVKKKSSQQSQFTNLTINQLDAGKVKHILRCLSQRH